MEGSLCHVFITSLAQQEWEQWVRTTAATAAAALTETL